MKRWGLLSLLLVLLVVMLAACNDELEDTGKENSDDNAGTEENPSGNLVIYTGRDEEWCRKSLKNSMSATRISK